jgi:hypothetical protein
MFSILRADKGNNPVVKELPAAAGTYKVGEVAVLTGGYITRVSGTTKPTYVTAAAGTYASGDAIAVNPIYDDMEFETTLSVDGSLAVGSKVTISATFDSITSTTTSGVAQIIETTGSTSGDKAIVKFV